MIPNLRQARQALELKNKVTVGCRHCHKSLWELTDIHQYGTKTGASKKSLCGYAWSDYWEKDNKTPKRIDCPFCHEEYFGAIQGPNETKFPNFWIKELNSVW